MPNRTSFAKTIAEAKIVGEQAALARHNEIAGDPLWSECGGAHMSLKLEEDKWQRFFNSLIEKPLAGFAVTSGGEGNYFVSIFGLASYQEMTVCLAAADAALAILEQVTGGKGKSRGYLS